MPEIEQVFPKTGAGLAAYVGNLNFDTRTPGRATPAFDAQQLSSADRLHYFVDAIETIAPLGTTTGGQPRQYAGANFTMWRLDNGVETADTTFVDVVQGMVICDLGVGSTLNVPFSLLGHAKMLLVGFGSSSTIKNASRNLGSDTSPWVTTNASTAAAFWLIQKAGADVYAVTDAGATIFGEYRVSKCPAGNDPTLAASWGNGLECGTPEWAIVGLAAIGDSIVAGKPDGLYYYNDQTKRFENVLPHLVGSPHPLNGKGMRSVTNGVLYPTHDGKLYLFDGVSVQEVTPGKNDIMPKDTGITRISAISDNGDTVAVVTDCWQNTAQVNIGLSVVTFIAGAYSDVTSSVTNGNMTDGAAMAGWGASAADALYIGANMPLEAVNLWCTRNVNAASVTFGIPAYSNGATFTSFTAGVDNTILSVSGKSLVNTGFPASASNSTLTWTDIDSFNKSQPYTGALNAALTVGKYWYRWQPTAGGTGMTNPTTIDEVEAVPCRRGLPNEGVLTQAYNNTPRDRAGGITHVYLGRRERTVGFVWHDVYAVNTLGGVWAIAWHNGRAGASSLNLGQALILWGRHRRFAIPESVTRDPARTIAPALSARATTTPNIVATLNLAPGGTYLGDQTRRKEIQRLMLDTRYLQPSDTISLYAQWDETDIFHVGDAHGGPAFIPFTSGFGSGRYMQLHLALSQGTYGALNAPEIRGAWVEYDVVGDMFDFPQDQAASIPART